MTWNDDLLTDFVVVDPLLSLGDFLRRVRDELPRFVVAEEADGSWSTARVTDGFLRFLGTFPSHRPAGEALASFNLQPAATVRTTTLVPQLATVIVDSRTRGLEIVVLDEADGVAGLLDTGDTSWSFGPTRSAGVEDYSTPLNTRGLETLAPDDPPEPGPAPSLYWVTDFPRDDAALRQRLLFAGVTYRLVTRFTPDRPAADDAAETTPIDHSYLHTKVQFEILAEGAVVRRALGETPFVDRVHSDPSVCEAGGTDPFEVDVRAGQPGPARIEIRVSVNGVPLDNAQLLEFAVIDTATSPAQAPRASTPPRTELNASAVPEQAVVYLRASDEDSERRARFTWERFGQYDIDFVSVKAGSDLGATLRAARTNLDQLARSYSTFEPSDADPLALGKPDEAYLDAARIGWRLHRALFGKRGGGDAPPSTREAAERIARLGRPGSSVGPGRRMLIDAPGTPFPWGLVYDGRYLEDGAEPSAADPVDPLGFWGSRFTIDRMVTRYGTEDPVSGLGGDDLTTCAVVNATIAPPVIDVGGHLKVMPEALARAVPITSAVGFRAWLGQPGTACDLVYFYCHAQPAHRVSDLGFFLEDPGDAQARLVLDRSTGGAVTVAEIKDGPTPAGNPIVFLAACSAGQGDPSFVSPFATLFIRSWGGRSLIASDAEVPNVFGHAFASRVMADFLEGNRSLGRSLAEVTRRLLDDHNPFGLYFGLHGRPEVFRRKGP